MSADAIQRRPAVGLRLDGPSATTPGNVSDGMPPTGAQNGFPQDRHRAERDRPRMISLAEFSVSDMVVCSAELRQATEGAASMEDAAGAIVRYLRSRFVDAATGHSAFVLARHFQTVPWERLTMQLRSYAQARMPAGQDPAGVRCLTLVATDGDHPHWCDRRASRDHQAIPLLGPDVLRRAPLVLALLDRLIGGAAHRLGTANGQRGDARRADHDGFDVFHVAEALGSPLVPAQEFVRTLGVRSAIVLGGVLPPTDSGDPSVSAGPLGGDVFSTVLFSRVPISTRTADLFRTLAASARLALAQFTTGPLFTPSGAMPVRPPDTSFDESISTPILGSAEPVIRVAPAPSHMAPPFPPAAAATAAPEALLPARRGGEDPDDAGEAFLTPPAPAVETELRDKQRRLEQESRIVETLYSVGQALSRELDMGRLVQTAIEAATSVVAAEFGAFFYTLPDRDGQPRVRFALAGAYREKFERFPMPRNTDLFGPTFPGRDAIRSADITRDPRYGQRAPHHGPPAGHPTVRSYLAMPVVTGTGETLGSFYFGHRNTAVFTERDEELAKGIAAQAAAAMDNARLYRQERRTAVELQRSLLPQSPPEVGELDVAFRYLPGAQGSQVGGDWFDVIPLAAGRVALVIGDVMGRGIRAAAIMGQLRTAVRAYAVMDLPPAQLMHQLNRLVCGMGADQIATCVYAVYDPGDATVCWANAGHLPPALITPGGAVGLLEADLGVPLGIDGAVFDEEIRPLPPGTRLLLYTDGLVECHDAPLSERLGQLRTELATITTGASPQDPLLRQLREGPEWDTAGGGGYGSDVGAEYACDRLLKAMLTGDEHDDVALLLVRTRPTQVLKAALPLEPNAASARAARRFVRSTLTEWDLEELVDTVTSVASELVTNACEHAGTPAELRLRRHPGRIIIEVADADGRIPRPAVTQLLDERHRGLLIVNHLAARWGVRPTDSGKVVWAEVSDVARTPAMPLIPVEV